MSDEIKRIPTIKNEDGVERWSGPRGFFLYADQRLVARNFLNGLMVMPMRFE